MNIETIRILYDYNYWAHRKVWDCLTHLSDERFSRAFDYSIGSVHHQVVHVMSAEWMWFSRLRGTSPTAMLDPNEFPTRPAIRAHWDELESDVGTFLASLTDDDLAQTIAYRTTEGHSRSMIMRGILLHVVNHGTDHRAQILSLLYQLGAPTVEQDMIFYLLEYQVQ